MCIREFGSKFSQQQLDMKENGNTKRQAFLPRWILDPKQIPDFWDDFSFEMLIYWTLRLKLIQGGNSRRSIPKHPKDPVMLVLCEQNQDSQYNTKISTPVKNDTTNSCIVGMIELSLQPPDADRNIHHRKSERRQDPIRTRFGAARMCPRRQSHDIVGATVASLPPVHKSRCCWK